MCERRGLPESGFLGELPHDRADVLEMSDRGPARGMLGAHLEQHVDERAGLEVLAPEPLVEGVEDREQLLFRGRASASGLSLDPAEPALLASLEEGQDEVVLGREVPVEGRLGDPARAITSSMPTSLMPRRENSS